MSEGEARARYDRCLAARILRRLRAAYPNPVDLPEHLINTSTLYELLQRGHIEFPLQGGNITKNISGDLLATNIGRATLTAKGYDAILSRRIKAIQLVAAIVTALSTGIVALVTVIRSP
ncbi:MAG: hypothetical protein OXQ89_22920 [Rhodospirillaceae bacterium]|nr:hypothetical protein [Rhodospirillaceae bacterium]